MIKISIQISTNGKEDSEKQEGSSQSSDYSIYSAEAKTIDEGILYLNNFLNKEINLSHCTALIISEDLAKDGIESFIKTLANNTELRHSCKIIVSSNTALDVLEKVSNSGEAFSARLYDYLASTTEYTGFTINSSFGDFFKDLDSSTIQPNAIYTLTSDDTVQTNGIAIFKSDKLIGNLNIQNSISHLMISNDLKYSVISIDSPFKNDEQIDLEISLYKRTNINISIINNSPFIILDVYPEASIKSSGTVFNYTDSENIAIIENTCNTYFEKNLKEYLYLISKKYNSDIIGFKGMYQANFFTNDDFDKIHWDEIFSDSFFKVNVHTKARSSNLFSKE